MLINVSFKARIKILIVLDIITVINITVIEIVIDIKK